MVVPERGLLIQVRAEGVQTAVIEGGRLVDLVIEPADAPSRVGEVHRARVTGVDRAVGGCFLALAGREEAFLGFEAGGDGPGAGDTLLVQVVRDAGRGKPLGCRRRIELGGSLIVFTPLAPDEIAVSRRIRDPAERERLRVMLARLAQPGEAWLARTAAAGAAADAIQSEAAALRGLAAGWEVEGPPARLYREPGPVERALRDHGRPDQEILIDDGAAFTLAKAYAAAALPGLVPALGHHRGPEPLFLAIEPEIEAALSSRIDLDCGAVLWIERTAALTAVDLDLGSAGSRGLGALEVDLLAAGEVARQIRLRSLGGAILVDFLRLHDRAERDRLIEGLRAAVAADRLPVQVLGFTRGGLVELTRPHGRPELARLLTRACDLCEGTGRQPLKEQQG